MSGLADAVEKRVVHARHHGKPLVKMAALTAALVHDIKRAESRVLPIGARYFTELARMRLPL